MTYLYTSLQNRDNIGYVQNDVPLQTLYTYNKIQIMSVRHYNWKNTMYFLAYVIQENDHSFGLCMISTFSYDDIGTLN